jgi:hypothetical protein
VDCSIGDVLGADCATFANTQYASEFTKPVELTMIGDSYRIVSFTLYKVPHGNARSRTMSVGDFYKK